MSTTKTNIQRFKQTLQEKQKTISLIASFIIPLTLTFLTECFARGSIKGAYSWMLQNPLYFLATLSFMAMVYCFLLFITDRPFVSFFIMFFPLTIAAVVSYAKMSMRELPLLPWNFILLNELPKDTTLLGNLLWIGILALLLFALLIGFLIYVLGTVRIKVKLIVRIVALILCVTMLFPCISAMASALPERYGVVELFEQRGFVAGFTSQIGRPRMETPENYSSGKVKEIYQATPNVSRSSQEQPDIIMIMGEAFWDPTWLPNVAYSSDPMPNLHRLQNSALHGKLLVEAYGGNTTNSEYSVLTSICTSLLAPELTCYTDLQKEKLPLSLPAHLNSLGYVSEAIHPGTDDYLDRDKVFEAFGFQKFYTEEDFTDPTLVGDYISDNDAADKIIELYEKHLAENPSKPYFSFTTTIQSHYDFPLEAYGDDYSIQVNPPKKMSKKDTHMLTGYVQGAHDSDKMIGKLTAYFEKQERDVIFIMFGDHLPSMANNFTLYQYGGLIQTGNYWNTKSFLPQSTALHSTPFLIWDNYQNKSEDLGTISACYLVPAMMSQYGLSMDSYRYYLSTIYRQVPTLGLAAYGNADGHQDKEEVKNLKILQYDLLY